MDWREDDTIPDIFFENKFTVGEHKGAIIEKKVFEENLINYYRLCGRYIQTSKPQIETLKGLALEFT